jgi:EAL domain-containing protein (putative c-di-GMP-specific phosphodiesterase class I)
MTYLKRFPVESLKVDRSFVDGLGRETEATAICTAVVSLAHALGMGAVAEGVETPEQLAALRTLGCEFAQGYLFGKPAPADRFGFRSAGPQALESGPTDDGRPLARSAHD